MTTTVVPLGTVNFRVELTPDEVRERAAEPAAYMRHLAETHILPALREHGITDPVDPDCVIRGSSIRAWDDDNGNRVVRVRFPHPAGPARPHEINPLHGLQVRLHDGPLAGHTTNIALADPDCIEIAYHPGTEQWASGLFDGPLPEAQLLRYCRTGYDLATGQWVYELEEDTNP